MFWDPSPIAFKLPFIQWPVTWYGILFVSGLLLSCFLLTFLLQKTLSIPRALAVRLVDRLTWYMLVSIIVGARLGHILFYSPLYYFTHPLDIFKIWEGGLASHGAAIAIPIGIWLFYRRYRKALAPLNFLQFFDLFVISVPLTGTFIRCGNFINQEIVGTPTSLPWAVTFGHPLERVAAVPRHPVQLYEAATYFVIFLLLFICWKGHFLEKAGRRLGLVFLFIFTSRFFLEFFKEAQSAYFTSWNLQMGQVLSLPFIALGLYFLIRPSEKIQCKN